MWFHQWTTRIKYYNTSLKLSSGRFNSMRWEASLYTYIYIYMSSIENEETFNDWNVYTKVPFWKSIVKCVRNINIFHDTCSCTEDHNLHLVSYGKICRGLVPVSAECDATTLLLCRALFLLIAGCWLDRSCARKKKTYDVWRHVIFGCARIRHAVTLLELHR